MVEDSEATALGEVLGIVELKTVMAKIRDGSGKTLVKIALVVPDGEVYILDDGLDGNVRMKASQAWVKSQILKKLAKS